VSKLIHITVIKKLCYVMLGLFPLSICHEDRFGHHRCTDILVFLKRPLN